MKNARANRLDLAVALVVFIALFFFFGFHQLLFYPPGGIHFMRQTDSLSFASQYYNNGFQFFSPQLFNLDSVDAKAACEFPILYYLTAFLYAVFGNEPFVFRAVTFGLSFIGVYSTYKIGVCFIKDKIYAAFVALFVFTSAVFTYYSINFLPDIGALTFALLGWRYYFEYINSNSKKQRHYSLLFFLISGLIKITYLINPLTIVVWTLFTVFTKKAESKKAVKLVLFMVGLIMLVVAWTAYMFHYNATYESVAFNTKALPIWNLNYNKIQAVLHEVSHYWSKHYLFLGSYAVLLLSVILSLVFWSKNNRMLRQLTFVLLGGVAAYVILFFSQFKDHDYYALLFIPLLIFVLIQGFVVLSTVQLNTIKSVGLKTVLLLLLLFGMKRAKDITTYRFNLPPDKYAHMGHIIHGLKDDIALLNIPKDARIILAPEYAQNGGLYFLNRYGFTLKDAQDLTPKLIEKLKFKGATHIFLASDNKEIKSRLKQEYTELFEQQELVIYQLDSK